MRRFVTRRGDGPPCDPRASADDQRVVHAPIFVPSRPAARTAASGRGGGGWLDRLRQDVRVGIRGLARRPAFTGAVVATLALGIGANTLIFTVFDRALLRPLPYPDADRLVAVWQRDRERGRNDKLTGGALGDVSTRTRVFAAVGYSWDMASTLTGVDHPRSLRGFQFSTNLFALLGASAVLGRTFAPGDDEPGHDHVVILSDHLWRDAFGARRDVVGQTVRLDGSPYTVIGVMGDRFAHPEASVDLWTPLAVPPSLARNRSLHAFNVVARLRPGVAVHDAEREVSALAAVARREYPATDASFGLAVEPLRDVYLGAARPALWVLQAAVILMLVIAAANVANLLLARATNTVRDVAVRRALGATRRRLVHQYVVEGVLLSCLGAAAGLALAAFGVDVLPRLFQSQLGNTPRDLADGLSGRAVAFTGVVALGAGLVFGLLAALHDERESYEVLRSGGRRGTARRATTRLRGVLVVAQVALSLVLLAGSGLLIKSFVRLGERSLGFATDRRLTFLLQLPTDRYPDLARSAVYLDQVLARIAALPGVEGAAATSGLPLSGMDARRLLLLPGEPDSAGERAVVRYRVVSPAYFTTMAIPLVRGRSFAASDRAGAEDVAIVNETLARTRWPGGDPIGKVVRIAGGPSRSVARVVGVVGDVRHGGLASEAEPELYRPTGQVYWPFFAVVARTAANPALVARAVERAVWAVDPAQPIDALRSMGALASEAVALRRASMILVSAFAAVALVLAVVGIYGVIAYLVAARTREIGIRLALGASPTAVTEGVVATGARVALAGVGIGLVVAFALTRFLGTLLFGVAPMDAGTIALATGGALVAALGASYVPARRAARVDPAITLRED